VSLGQCDPDEAQKILDASCQVLTTAGGPKADFGSALSQISCRMGPLSACKVSQCLDNEGLDLPEESASCSDWQAFKGCASCNYYDCRERVHQCGASGYLQEYGGRYCRRFAQVTEPLASDEGAAWLNRVRGCLINYLENEIPYDADCETVERLGFDSHALCYIETGFCDLAPTDWFKIMQTVDPSDFPLRSILQTGFGCLKEWL